MQRIDAFIYINLDKRIDRKEEILREFKNFEIPEERIYRIKGVDSDVPGLGCTLAHINALKFAKKNNFKYFIIFEDDFTFIIDPKTFNDNLCSFFNLDINFNVVMLGYNLKKSKHLNDIIGYALETQTASSYLVNGNYTETLINCLEEGASKLAITHQHWNYMNDQYWKKLQSDNWYYFVTRIGIQRPGFSDCAKGFRNYGV
jgi:glycosyl transferase, family 25